MTFTDPLEHDFPEWLLHGDHFYYAADVVSFGDPLTTANLREAYQLGIFPWYMRGIPLPWYCPERRAILEFADLHIPRSLERARRKELFTFSIDTAFRRVIEQCSRAYRPGQRGTWIMPEFITAFTKLHEEGMAHSIEAWNANGELVGGIYGVDAGGVFCGESMFFTEPNASKLCLLYLFDHLRSRGSTWFDTQVITPHMAKLGAKEIDRREFLIKLNTTLALGLKLF